MNGETYACASEMSAEDLSTLRLLNRRAGGIKTLAFGETVTLKGRTMHRLNCGVSPKLEIYADISCVGSQSGRSVVRVPISKEEIQEEASLPTIQAEARFKEVCAHSGGEYRGTWGVKIQE